MSLLNEQFRICPPFESAANRMLKRWKPKRMERHDYSSFRYSRVQRTRQDFQKRIRRTLHGKIVISANIVSTRHVYTCLPDVRIKIAT